MSKKSSLISIAMATCNGERFLLQQLESISSQTYKHIELIICDDFSTDRTIEIINQYKQQCPYIKLYQNDTQMGFVKNFEKAIGLCSGEYIALSDQDDIWEHEKLEKQLEAILKEELKFPNVPIMVHSDLAMIDENNETIGDSYFYYKKYKLKATKDLGHIAGPCGVMGNTILFNRNLKDKILPFPEMVEYHDYWIAMINELYGVRITMNEKLVKYRIHQSNTSNTDQKLSSYKVSLRLLSDFIDSKIVPPFIVSKREQIICYLLNRGDIKQSDKKILSDFLHYLQGEGSRIKQLYLLLKHSLLKRDWLYRIGVILNYIFYDRKNLV